MRSLVTCILVTMLFVSMVQIPSGSGQDGAPPKLFPIPIYLKTGLEFKPQLPDEGQTAERREAQKDIETFPPGGNGVITNSYRTDVAEWNGDSLLDEIVLDTSAKFVFWAMNAEEDTSLEYDFWIDLYAQPSGAVIHQTPEDDPFTVTLGYQAPQKVEFSFNIGGNGSTDRISNGESLKLDLDFRSNRDVAVYYDGEQDGVLMLSYLQITCNAVEMHDLKASESSIKVTYQNAFNSQLYWKLEIDGIPVQGNPVRDTSGEGKVMKWSVSSGSGKHNAVVKISYEPIESEGGNQTNGTFFSFLGPYTIKDSEDESFLGQMGLPGFEAVMVAAAVSVALLLRKRTRG